MSALDVVLTHFYSGEADRELAQLREAAAKREALESAVSEARELLTTLDWNDWSDKADAWLAAHPALTSCTCGMGNATMPEYHAVDCALKAITG